jgi:hypothetical protein
MATNYHQSFDLRSLAYVNYIFCSLNVITVLGCEQEKKTIGDSIPYPLLVHFEKIRYSHRIADPDSIGSVDPESGSGSRRDPQK